MSESTAISKKGTKSIETTIVKADGFKYDSTVKTNKSGKKTTIVNKAMPDKTSSYVYEVTSADGNVSRKSIETYPNGDSFIKVITGRIKTDTVDNTGSDNELSKETPDDYLVSFADDTEIETDTVLTYISTDGKNVKLTGCITTNTELTIPDKIKIDGITFKVSAVAKNAFKGNTSLKTVILGKYVTVIGTKAFAGLSNLETICFNAKKITKISDGAFSGISENAEFFMNGSSMARKSAASKLKKSGYKQVAVNKL